jgi:uncharacterized membrane protein YesL
VRAALAVIGETLADWWNGMVGLAMMNVVWLGLSLTVVLCPPATIAMYAVTNGIARGIGQHLDDFVRAMRRYVWISLRWALVNLLVVVILYVNLSFYGTAHGALASFVLVGLTCLAALWLAMQFYTGPFLIEQEDKRLRLALRNAAFLALATPVYTLTMLVAAGLAIVLSVVTVLPVAVFTLSFLALLGNRAVIERLAMFGKLSGPGQPPDAGEETP